MAAIRLTRTHRILVGIVVAGAVIIAGIGFAGSYAAVRTLALHKGFGWFANVFPIGVDAGIVVLLALDLLLTWLRIPFPLLRQTAWLLTGATIAFNGAAAWPDPLGVGMHAIIPVLFVVSVEAARHAIGRVADITADKHMESVRITRWILAPVPTFRLWRRMKLWELRSYEEVIRREQDRLVYRARLRARYGVAWRRKAPIEAIMPLRLARYGVPLSETADAGLEAAGIELSSARRALEPGSAPAAAGTGTEAVTNAPAAAGAAAGAEAGAAVREEAAQGPAAQGPAVQAPPAQGPAPAPAAQAQGQAQAQTQAQGQGQGQVQQYGPEYDQQQAYEQQMAQQFAQQMYEQQVYEQQQYAEQMQYAQHNSPWFAAQQRYVPYPFTGPQGEPMQQQVPVPQMQGAQPEQPVQMVPSGAPGRQRPLGNVGMNGLNTVNGFTAAGGPANGSAPGINGGPGYPQPPFRLTPDVDPAVEPAVEADAGAAPYDPAPGPEAGPAPEDPETDLYPAAGLNLPDGVSREDAYYAAYRRSANERGELPNARQLVRSLSDMYAGTPPEERQLVAALRELRYRFNSEAEGEHIP